jgi:Ca2+-binding EF-hand superfamily protein
MIATDMSSSGDPEEKLRKLISVKVFLKVQLSSAPLLRWAFRMYDKDGSGEIDLDEMVEIFCLMYAVQVEIS